MEKQQALLKVKPILPQRIWITKEHTYGDFIKKHYRVLPKLYLQKSENLIHPSLTRIDSFESLNYFDIFSLFKIFKPLKYIRELDLSNMLLQHKPYSPSKVIYLAKRMSNSQVIRIPDLKNLVSLYEGQTELWVRYAKRAQVFGYSCFLEKNNHHVDQNLFDRSSNDSTFIHLIKYQPQIKDLTVQFCLNGQFLPEAYFEFERYPPNLERLSLKGILFDKDVPSSMHHHLKSLKHFEILFHTKATSIFIFFLIKQLTSLSNLQSLSLSCPRLIKQDPSLAFSKKTRFKSLIILKLCFQSKIANLVNIFGAFTECPLHHLKFQALIKSDHEFMQIVNFIANFKSLERLQLKIICWNSFESQNLLTQLLDQIGSLSLLTHLSVSISPVSQWNSSHKAIIPFKQLFTKPVLLKSFKLHFQNFDVSTKGFLQTLKALGRHAPTLRKLRVDIGECELSQNEFKAVLRFIKCLQKIRSLQFTNLQISSESFLRNLAEALYHMPYLEKFAVGQMNDQWLRETILISSVERILKKRGLRKFFCSISRRYEKEGPFDKSLRLNLATIQKINPYLKKVPDISIFKRDDDFIDM